MSSTRQKIVVLFTLMILAALPVIADAGGWAVVTLDAMPVEVMAEKPFTIGFMVRQHGQHPTPGLDGRVTAVHVKTGQSVTFDAVEQGGAGHYVATITLPLAGTWQWHVNTWGDTNFPMPDLEVLSPAAASTSTLPATPSWPAGLGLIALLGTVISLLFWQRRRRQWALGMAATMGIIGLVGLGAFLVGGEMAAVQRVAAHPHSANWGAESYSPAEQGKRLFLAKGCVNCHHYESVGTGSFSSGIGPNLTHYSNSPEFLRSWLGDPKAIKPETLMPDLGLSEDEISLLIAFLNDDLATPPS